MVLAPETRLIWCLGDDDTLPDFLRMLGYEVLERPELLIPGSRGPAPDAILIAGDAKAAAATAKQAAAVIDPCGVVAVQVAGGPRVAPKRVARTVRALELAASPLAAVSAELAARRVAREMRRAGFEVMSMRTGDRSRANYGLGRGWLRRRRLPLGSIVTGRHERRATVAEAAAAEAAPMLKRTLAPHEADVVQSGKLGIRLVDPQGDAHHLSIVAAETTVRMRRAQTALDAILAADPPAPLRDRIIAPSASGRVGPVDYVLEPYAPGAHPIWAGARLWEDCLEFLTALHCLPRQTPELALAPGWPNIDEAAEFLARVAGADQLKLVERLRREVTARTHGLPVGGGHGDFWSQNLMVHGGRLRAVVDWEWASTDSLPLLDLLDFWTEMGGGGRRGLPPGVGFTEVLWPLVRRGGDERLRRLAEATGTPTDTGTLEGLVMAHWLLRTARAGVSDPQRVEDPIWFRDNVMSPLALLTAQQQTQHAERSPAAAQRRLRVPMRSGDRFRSERPKPSEIIVLAYHAVSEEWPCELAVTPRQLEAQVRLLIERGFRGVTFSEAVLAPPSAPILAVTFDDAYRSTLDLAYPILSRLGIPATVFVPTAFPDGGSPMAWPGIEQWLGGRHERELLPMSWTQLSKLSEAGWEIGSHSHRHPRLTRLDDDSLARELTTSRNACERHLGISCRSLAYPYGDDDPRVIAAAHVAGYEAACTLSSHLGAPVPLRWPRIGVYRDDDALRFRLKVSPAMRRARSARGWKLVAALRERSAP
ncbi:MAG: polysaccharide deacetylase family protein [Chloroflexota bacterium]|nr:polysaccharide deacetylase family protein [Chloroflexota bacterium]